MRAPLIQRKSGFASIFVARPIFGLVINVLVLIAGLAALNSVDVREMPDVDRPVLSVRTSYTGAVPQTVDQEITQPLEDALSSLEGLAFISSSSSTGSSRITIDLTEGTDVDIAANEAREIVSQVSRRLPDDVDDPTVTKSDSNADPIIRLALLGTKSLAEMTAFAEGAIYDRLSVIDGIAEVTVRGNQAYEFRVNVAMPSLLSRGLTMDDLSDAIATLRDDTPLGDLENTNQSISLRSANPTVTTEIVGNVLINDTTRVSDVAHVQYVPQDRSASARVNGESAIGIEITRQSVGNTLSISKAVRAEIEELQKIIPDGMQLIVASDDGVFIESSINEVLKSIGLATLIVISVIFLFLRSLRATLIPAATIPIALVGTIAAIWITGFSINTISLLALVLATGMVVDDAIVVIENIVRKRRDGMGPYAAAVAGTNEVFFAVISTTATLAAVFIPISFLPGQAGGVFSEFGFVLAFAVTLSSLTALTLTPVMAAFLDPGKNAMDEARAAKPEDNFAVRAFDKAMDFAIRTPSVILAVAAAFVILTMGAANNLPSSITPTEDRGFFLIPVRGANDATLAYMETQVTEVEEILSPYIESGEIAAVQSLLGRGGTSRAFIIARLADWSERDRSQQELMAELGRSLANIPGVTVSARSGNSLNIRGGGSGLQFAVSGNNLDLMTEAAGDLVAEMGQSDTFVNPQLGAQAVEAYLQVEVDSDMAALFGLTPRQVTSNISTMTQGVTATSVFVDDTEVDIRLVPGDTSIDDPTDIESIFVQSPNGQYVPLSVLASLETVVGASGVVREGGALAISAQGNLDEGVDIGDAMAELQDIAAEVLPDGTRLTFLGEAAALKSSQNSMILVFGVAFIVVFLVLAAQFESMASAVVIMMTVPFGLAAAVMAIVISGGSLNYYSQIGLVMLIGVMAKNGILIVEFANQLREAGQDIDSAIRDALRMRIRPVMMTMVSTVFGGVPLIMTSGAGAEARIAVGWVIVGGLGFATVFTLFLTPVFYRWVAVWGAAPGVAAKKLAKEQADIGAAQES